MSKSITVASKFSEEELDKIDWYVKEHNTTRSALFHDFVMKGVNGEQMTPIFTKESKIKEVKLLFKKDFTYFFKGKVYKGIINGDDVSVYIGGEWKNYKRKDIPVEVIE